MMATMRGDRRSYWSNRHSIMIFAGALVVLALIQVAVRHTSNALDFGTAFMVAVAFDAAFFGSGIAASLLFVGVMNKLIPEQRSRKWYFLMILKAGQLVSFVVGLALFFRDAHLIWGMA